MKSRILVFWVVLLVLLSAVALADIVVLHSGAKIEGVARQEGNKVIVESVYGSTTISADLVKEIIRSSTPLAEYRQMAAQASPTSLRDQVALADWCKKNYLADYEKYHLALALALEPENLSIRSRLGYVKHRERYITKSEEMSERGFVKFRSRWVTPQEYNQTLLEEKAQAEQIARERAAQEEKRREERRRRVAEYLAEERERQALERESLGNFGVPYTSPAEPYYYGGGYWRYRDYLLFGRGLGYPYWHYGVQPRRAERVTRSGDFIRRGTSGVRGRR